MGHDYYFVKRKIKKIILYYGLLLLSFIIIGSQQSEKQIHLLCKFTFDFKYMLQNKTEVS